MVHFKREEIAQRETIIFDKVATLARESCPLPKNLNGHYIHFVIDLFSFYINKIYVKGINTYSHIQKFYSI